MFLLVVLVVVVLVVVVVVVVITIPARNDEPFEKVELVSPYFSKGITLFQKLLMEKVIVINLSYLVSLNGFTWIEFFIH